MRVKKYIGITIVLFFILGGIYLFVSYITLNSLPLSGTKQNLRLTAMNIHVGNLFNKQEQQDLINSQSDLLLMLEWNGDNVGLALFEQAGYHLAVNEPRKGVHGLAVLSKLTGTGFLLPSPVTSPCALPLGQFRFKMGSQNMLLFVVHAPPPVSACENTNEPYLLKIASWIDNGKLIHDIGIGKKGDAVMLAGDFNCLPWSKAMRVFRSKGLTDVFSDGIAPQPTWSGLGILPPMARIDYVFIPQSTGWTHRYRFAIKGSDHAGLSVDLPLK